MKNKPSCLIIGAGISGLAAATTLQNAGWAVTVLDKGRGVGGRAATRRFGGAVFDHGAQYFTVRDERFQAYVDRWLTDGVVTQWADGFPNSDDLTARGSHPRYRGVNGMTHMAKAMAASLNVHTSTAVERVDYEDGQWRVVISKPEADDEQAFQADTLIMTPPAPQTLALIQAGNVALPSATTQALQAITFESNFSVLLLLDAPSEVPPPGGIFVKPSEPIEWIADNEQKGISLTPSLTVRTGPSFTQAHYNDDRDTIALTVIDEVRPYLGQANVISYQVQRWRYSSPSNQHPDKTLFVDDPAPIAFAGDAFGGARVEGAFLSGLAAAQQIDETRQ